jgi:hypothetical protein
MLPIIAIAAGLAGCVMPPDAEYVLTPPNQPPQITLSAPAPYFGIVYQGPECDPLEQRYSVWVLDPDVSDKLYWRAFVDYGTNWPQAFTSGELDNNATAQAIGVPVRGDDSRFGKLIGVPHMIEIVVADRKFADDDRPPRGHAPEDTKGFVVSTIWTVQYVDKGCGP